MAQNLIVCSIDPGVVEKMKKFKMRKTKNMAAIVLKVDATKQEVVLDEEYEDCTLEEVVNELPESQPRYILFSYVHNHGDGRVSYPQFFIFCSPLGCKPEQNMMYAGTKLSVVDAAGATKFLEARAPEEITEESLIKKL